MEETINGTNFLLHDLMFWFCSTTQTHRYQHSRPFSKLKFVASIDLLVRLSLLSSSLFCQLVLSFSYLCCRPCCLRSKIVVVILVVVVIAQLSLYINLLLPLLINIATLASTINWNLINILASGSRDNSKSNLSIYLLF